MKKTYSIKKKLSLRENLKRVIPEMFDDFISYAPVVMSFPLRKNQLHEMRKAGKPLRYAMELGEYCFQPDFKLCLEEVKSSLDLMGEVHDADVMIPDISLHMKEIRMFNNTIKDNDLRISTRQLRASVLKLREQRRSEYAALSEKLKLWGETNFRARIVTAMNSTPLNT